MKSGILVYATAAVVAAVQTLPAQQAAQQAAQSTLLKVAESEGVVMSLDSASIVRTADSTFMVHTVTRFPQPVQREEGDSIDTEVDSEEIDCARHRVRGFSADLFLAGREVHSVQLPAAWMPVPPGRLPLVQASCGVLLSSFAASLPVPGPLNEEFPELINAAFVQQRLHREYPALSRSPSFRADVTLRLRVGTDGRPVPGTLQIMSETQPELANAMRRIVPDMRFRPARVGGRAVAGWVMLPVRLLQHGEVGRADLEP
ncbi:MAG TPA: surface-adhesin E family protein [Longimicrobium sp.]|jgi:hypothetical protein